MLTQRFFRIFQINAEDLFQQPKGKKRIQSENIIIYLKFTFEAKFATKSFEDFAVFECIVFNIILFFINIF